MAKNIPLEMAQHIWGEMEFSCPVTQEWSSMNLSIRSKKYWQPGSCVVREKAKINHIWCVTLKMNLNPQNRYILVLLLLVLAKLQKGQQRQREDTGLSFELCLSTVFSRSLAVQWGFLKVRSQGNGTSTQWDIYYEHCLLAELAKSR